MHQAQPKEGHKIWLTQEADAKSWSSLKHVQPKEGRKELAPREIKFRYRRLDTTIRERAGSSQVPREAQESERYPGLFFFASFFSLSGAIRVLVALVRMIQDFWARASTMWLLGELGIFLFCSPGFWDVVDLLRALSPGG